MSSVLIRHMFCAKQEDVNAWCRAFPYYGTRSHTGSRATAHDRKTAAAQSFNAEASAHGLVDLFLPDGDPSADDRRAEKELEPLKCAEKAGLLRGHAADFNERERVGLTGDRPLATRWLDGVSSVSTSIGLNEFTNSTNRARYRSCRCCSTTMIVAVGKEMTCMACHRFILRAYRPVAALNLVNEPECITLPDRG